MNWNKTFQHCPDWYESQLFVSLKIHWKVLFFLEYWKRYSKKLSNRWNVKDCNLLEVSGHFFCQALNTSFKCTITNKKKENVRSDYCFYATKECFNRRTKQKEPYFPVYLARLRRFFGFVVVLAFVTLTVACHFLVIILRLCVYHYMFLADGLRPFSSFVSNLISSLVNLLVIGLIDKIFEALATKLTKWGMIWTV